MVHFSHSVREHLAVSLTAIDTKQWVVRNNMMAIEGITNFLNEGEGLPRIRAENIVRTMKKMMLMKMQTRTTMMSRFHNWPFKNCCRSLHFSSLLSFRAHLVTVQLVLIGPLGSGVRPLSSSLKLLPYGMSQVGWRSI